MSIKMYNQSLKTMLHRFFRNINLKEIRFSNFKKMPKKCNFHFLKN